MIHLWNMISLEIKFDQCVVSTWSRWLHALNMGLRPHVDLLLSWLRTMPLLGAALPKSTSLPFWKDFYRTVESTVVEDSAAARAALPSAAVGKSAPARGLTRVLEQTEPKLPNLSCPIPFFYPFSYGTTFGWLGRTIPPLVSTIPLPPSKFNSPIHEVILLMSGQCTNPGPRFRSPVWRDLFVKTKANIHTNVPIAGPGFTKSAKDCRMPRFITSCGFVPDSRHLPPLT